MMKALCNASAEAEPKCDKHGSMHICSFDHGHKGPMHLCRCGTIWADVKQSEIDLAGQKLEKVQ